MRVRDLDYAFCSKTRHSPQSAHLNLDPSTFQFVRSPARTCVALRASSRSFRVSAPATQQDNQQAQDHKNQNRDHGNGAPNCKNLTSPSVAVFLEDYIKSALNTLIQAAYSRWRRAAKWHEPAFSQLVACDMPLQEEEKASKTGQCSMALPGSWVLVRI
jgi:hypothetical protein